MTRSPAAHRAVLSRDLSDFLLDLSSAWQRLGMYPPGHPLIGPAVAAVLRRLDVLLLERPALAIAVGHGQLVVGGTPTDPSHDLLRELALRLHRRGVGGLRLHRGVTAGEITELLALLTTDVVDGVAAESHDDPTAQWPNLELLPLGYDRLTLLDDDATGESSWGDRLWEMVARAAVGEWDVGGEVPGSEVVARRFAEHAADEIRDARVARSLREIASAARARGRSEVALLQRQLGRLIRELPPDAAARVLRASGADPARRLAFISEIADVLTAGAVLELARHAARDDAHPLSDGLLRLLGKLAVHADGDEPRLRPRAERAFRRQLDRLMASWRDDTSGETPNRAHSPVPPPTVEPGGPPAYPAEAQRVLLMSVEIGVVDVATRRALERLLQHGEVASLLDVLESLPCEDPVVAELRAYVYTEHTVALLLGRNPIDFDALARLVPTSGVAASGLLFDALAHSKDRRTRAKLLELLARFGTDAGPDAAARLEGAPWYVQRNLLRLLAQLPELPLGFDAERWTGATDPRVRHEALRLLLTRGEHRDGALHLALAASDAPTVRLGLLAALERCGREHVAPLARVSRDPRFGSDLRVLAARALGAITDPAVVPHLLALATERAAWRWWTTLAPRSPEMLAALTALATHWVGHPQAERVVRLAARQRDPDVRRAGAPRRTPEEPAPGDRPRVIV